MVGSDCESSKSWKYEEFFPINENKKTKKKKIRKERETKEEKEIEKKDRKISWKSWKERKWGKRWYRKRVVIR